MLASEVRPVAETADEFEDWYEAVEPRVRAALVARYGPEVGREAAAAALAWAWEDWDQVSVNEEQGRLPVPGGTVQDASQARRLPGSHRVSAALTGARSHLRGQPPLGTRH